VRTLAIALILVLISGCASPGYYAQAVAGQWHLVNDRQDIGEVLENPEAAPELKAQLQSARDILKFADEELGLPAGDSYQSYVKTGRQAVVWNVVAAPEFSLSPEKWCFLVAGCVPYRGYFEKEKAEKFADNLRQKGFDVSVNPTNAYSTLGWFKDPLLDTMLRGSDTYLAATLFHELAHQRLYIKGETSFNEAYAGFVELTGTTAWISQKDHPEPKNAWLSQRLVRKDFHHLLTQARNKLSAIYRQELSETDMRKEKIKVFEELRISYEHVKNTKWQGRDYFGSWLSSDLNNARLALFYSYEGLMCAFEGLYKEAAGEIHKFHSLVEQRSELTAADRKAWLTKSCSGIASNENL
jgi:predicted aminopeptidase